MINVFSYYITRKDMDLVLGRMVEDAVGPGEYSERLSKVAKEVFGLEYAIPFRSPAIALQQGLSTMGLRKGDRIAISALAPAWHVEIVQEAGYEPAVLDVTRETLHPSKDAMLSAGARACILYDALGRLPPEDLRATGILTIEDLSQIWLLEPESETPGKKSNLVLLSFEDDAPVTTGGGCMLATYGKREVSVLRSLEERLPKVVKMTDYNAALGVSQIKSYKAVMERRAAIAEKLMAQARKSRHTLLSAPDEPLSLYALPLLVEGASKEVMQYARQHGVHTVLAFADSIVLTDSEASTSYATARDLALRSLLFPLHHTMTNEEVEKVGKVLATLP
ncbi:MAG: DegT/DnrJ/EryC1/StrS family aminotransferase [Rectinemataceae bacterium]